MTGISSPFQYYSNQTNRTQNKQKEREVLRTQKTSSRGGAPDLQEKRVLTCIDKSLLNKIATIESRSKQDKDMFRKSQYIIHLTSYGQHQSIK
jgi:hypothetical protein